MNLHVVPPLLAQAAAARRRQGRLARRLIDAAPGHVARIAWSELAQAPGWMAWSVADLARGSRRLGALAYAEVTEGWIDAGLMAALREAVGPGWPGAVPASGLPARPTVRPEWLLPVRRPRHVAPALQAVGAAVLVGATAPGIWQAVAREMLAPLALSGSVPDWPREAAQALVDTACADGVFDPCGASGTVGAEA